MSQLFKSRLDNSRDQLFRMYLNHIILLEDGMTLEIGSKILPALGHMFSNNALYNLGQCLELVGINFCVWCPTCHQKIVGPSHQLASDTHFVGLE